MTNKPVFIESTAVPNATLLHTLASWDPSIQPSWVDLHWTVVPREIWPKGWLPPEKHRWQRPDYFPEAINPHTTNRQ